MILSDSTTCEWFALCMNSIDGFVAHPILGLVPTCSRCAEKMRQTFARFVIDCQNDERGCNAQHVAEYHHPGRFGEGPIFAVICDEDGLTDYYTSELLTLVEGK